MNEKIPVSVVVPVKNEEQNLAHCLARLTRFAEVIVVDSRSEDRTPEIASASGAHVVQFDWNGEYPKKRNWILQSYKFSCRWILFLDADELIDDAFCSELEGAIQDPRYVGYWLNYTNFFLGRPLRHGDPQRKLALFRLGAGLYERIDEQGWSRLDMEVHEHPILEGPVGEIRARIEHNDDRGVSKFIDRHRDYAMWEARRVQALRQGGAEGRRHLTSRQRLKYDNIDKWWFAWSYFFACYIGKRGFLDGGPGFAIAFYKLWYFLTVRLLIREQNTQTVPSAALGRQVTRESRRVCQRRRHSPNS